MQQFIVPVNNEALSRALVAVTSAETAELILKAYKAIEEAMTFGYQAGISAGDEQRKMAAAEYVASLELADEELQQAFDDGYVDGVSDARSNPEEADAYIECLCQQDDAWDALDEAYEAQHDSGDENTVVVGEDDDAIWVGH
jgi:hypothetical protein